MISGRIHLKELMSFVFGVQFMSSTLIIVTIITTLTSPVPFLLSVVALYLVILIFRPLREYSIQLNEFQQGYLH